MWVILYNRHFILCCLKYQGVQMGSSFDLKPKVYSKTKQISSVIQTLLD